MMNAKSNDSSQIFLVICIFFDKNVFFDVSSYWAVYTSPSLNLLISSSFRLISASRESLKSRFHHKNRDELPLECQISSLKSRNEKPMIWWSIESFRAWHLVRLCVFLLIFSLVSFSLNHRLVEFLINFWFSLSSLTFVYPNFCSLISSRISFQIKWFFILWIFLGVLFLILLNS